ncbi:VOC family protein [Solicola gregarius]|uniref:VOC family protein n=1 Tax=Solicola gregarius TaxID=2908642 RepID=A0AA46YJX0_9ACTN|nr:VOC family protein [Solicola gregarius]UYM04019.1 VOC family protein [Solicola gregarius]
MDERTRVRWLTAVVSSPHADAVRFWSAVTGSTPDGSAGYVPLRPQNADPYVWLDRDDREVRLIVHVDDPAVAVQRAASLGATRIDASDSMARLTSPGGLAFGVTGAGPPRRRPAPLSWPGGHRSILDQVSVDISPGAHETEVAFLESLLGWPVRHGARPEFDYLVRQPEQALRILLQRLDVPAYGATSTHVDLACDSVPDEVARHLALGATLVADYPLWTTMRDPAGAAYCLTRRSPDTGALT